MLANQTRVAHIADFAAVDDPWILPVISADAVPDFFGVIVIRTHVGRIFESGRYRNRVAQRFGACLVDVIGPLLPAELCADPHFRGIHVLYPDSKRTRQREVLSNAQVVEQLKAGKSLAQIAQDKGKSADTIIATVRTELKQRLDKAVTNNRLTQAKADEALANFDKNAPTVMQDATLGQSIQQRQDQRQKGAAAGLLKVRWPLGLLGALRLSPGFQLPGRAVERGAEAVFFGSKPSITLTGINCLVKRSIRLTFIPSA